MDTLCWAEMKKAKLIWWLKLTLDVRNCLVGLKSGQMSYMTEESGVRGCWPSAEHTAVLASPARWLAYRTDRDM